MPLLYHNEGQTMLHTAGIFGNLSVIPTPANHAISTQLKAGETVYQADKVSETFLETFQKYFRNLES